MGQDNGMIERQSHDPGGTDQLTLTWWRFYLECVRYAVTGAWGMVGDVATALPLFMLALKDNSPRTYAAFNLWLAKRGLGADWMLLMPAGVGGAILLFRMVVKPYLLYRASRGAVRGNTTELATRVSVIAAELMQFVVARRDTTPPTFAWNAYEAGERARAAAHHYHETNRLYFERFANRIGQLRNELLSYGLRDEVLDSSYMNPRDDENMITTAERLKTFAEVLRSPGSVLVSQDHLVKQLQARLAEVQPRSVTPEQRDTILAEVKPAAQALKESKRNPPYVNVTTAGQDFDCTMYARDFENVFMSCGFAVSSYDGFIRPPVTRDPTSNEIDDLTHGLTIRWDSATFANTAPEARYVDALLRALRTAEIHFTALDRTDCSFDVFIGDRTRSSQHQGNVQALEPPKANNAASVIEPTARERE